MSPPICLPWIVPSYFKPTYIDELYLKDVSSITISPVFVSISKQFHSTLLVFIFTVLYAILYSLIRYYISKRNVVKKEKKIFKRTFAYENEFSYAVASLVVNTLLSIYGLYHFLYTLPSLSNITASERIIKNFPSCDIISALQISINTFSLFINSLPLNCGGLDQDFLMIIHHLSTLGFCSFCLYFTNGFRYYVPFACGITEISSIPLFFMKYLQKDYEWTMNHRKLTYKVIRLLFAVSFLLIRVYCWTIINKDMWKCAIALYQFCDNLACEWTMNSLFAMDMILTGLQYYWGLLIIKAMLRMICPSQFRIMKI